MSMLAGSRLLHASAPARHISHVAAGPNVASLRAANARSQRHVGVGAVRPVVLALAKLLLLPFAAAAPMGMAMFETRGVHVNHEDMEEPRPADDPNLWIYLGVAVALVLLGGAFAGLTIALMGQDETYLQVIASSGEGSERKNAEKVLKLLKNGKHWVLVTLLLSNVITNETLPIVLDRSLGGGWPAVVSSTVLIVIFGEVAPQSVCVRYGLAIGAYMSPFVLILMWIMCPVAWPTAKLLDWLLGEEHGTTYKKAGLKTLVQLHKTLGTTPGERLMEDEVTIISSVLDLKEKPVGDIMTPMQDVFTMSADTVLNERMMDTILSQGYSRIPIYAPENHRNFIGMLLVKILITYDPEDCKRVRDFALATLPETAPYTSCLDIINFFQEGKSHMVLVSDFPGQDKGALGVVTLEDVIEELIGEEIIDESDVFIDVHKAIRRMAPAPKTRFNKYSFAAEPFVSDSEWSGKEASEDDPLLVKSSSEGLRKAALLNGHAANGPSRTTLLMRRRSSTASESTHDALGPIPVRSSTEDMRKHLKHLGPSNAASRPRATKFNSVKIKPGVSTIPETSEHGVVEQPPPSRSQSENFRPTTPVVHDEHDILNSGMGASDGVAVLQAGYGTLSPPSSVLQDPANDRMTASEATRMAEANTDVPRRNSETKSTKSNKSNRSKRATPPSSSLKWPDKVVWGLDADGSQDSLGDLSGPPSVRTPRQATRSGSITEFMVDAGGIQKVVLEATSSSEDPEDTASARRLQLDGSSNGDTTAVEELPEEKDDADDAPGDADGKKRRRKRGKKKKASSD